MVDELKELEFVPSETATGIENHSVHTQNDRLISEETENEAKTVTECNDVAENSVDVGHKEVSGESAMETDSSIRVEQTAESVQPASDDAVKQAQADPAEAISDADEVEQPATVAVSVQRDASGQPQSESLAATITSPEAPAQLEQTPTVIGESKPAQPGNTSLGLIAQYASDSSDAEADEDDGVVVAGSEESSDEVQIEANATRILLDQVFQQNNYRDVSSDDDSDTESDSDVELVGVEEAEVIQINDEDDADYNALYDGLRNGPLADDENEKPSGPIKAKGEFGLDDLPPIADLTIKLTEEECIKIGHISGIVDTLVLVESEPNFAAVDIDTVMFLDKGNRTLGQVFDVMGVVTSPIYCVRFNKKEDIIAKGIQTGDVVYVAPRTEHTNFIVLADLMKQKGCDASWEDDIEPPTGLGEFSNDEEEQEARRNARHKKRPLQQQQQQQRTRTASECSSASSASQSSTRERPTAKSARNQRRNQQRQQQQQRRVGHAGAYQFYKDNRDYAAMPGNPTNQQYAQPQQFQYEHSWHTAGAMRQLPPPPPPPMAHVYPNPFAHQYQQQASTSGGPFNLQAFPPLPPPMADVHMQPSHHNPHFNQRQRQTKFTNYNKNRRNNF